MSSARDQTLIRHLAAVYQYSLRVSQQPAEAATPAERQQRFAQAVMQPSAVAMALTDTDLRLLACNAAFEDLFGYTQEVALGANLPILINDEATLAGAMADVRQAVTERITHATGRRRRQDGTPVYVELVGARVALGGGLEAVVMMYADISEQRRAEEWLHLANAALQAAANAVAVVNRGGEILWVNPAFTRLTGYPPEEAIGQTTRLLKSGKHDQAFYQKLWSTVLAGEMWQGETINRRKDGSLYVEDQTIAPVRDERGEIMHFISIKQDVTVRKQAEADLQLTKEAAEAANRAKSTFLSNMGHELRTPLNHIIGYAEMLEEAAAELGSEGQKFAADLRSIQTSARNLLVIVTDLLDISRLEAGKVELAPETFDPAALVRELAEAYRPQAAQHGNRLEVRAADGLGSMAADRAMLRQVLDHLVSNACKFTEQGSITLAASSEIIGPTVWLKFVVADTGIGIRPEQLDRIFLPFTQVDQSSTRRYSGSGLGLAVAQKFCELLGGEITVTSAGVPGQGTVFTVLLPARAES